MRCEFSQTGASGIAPFDDHLHSQINRTFGDYDWDRWKKKAVAAGVDPDLAQLGRDVMREAYQHYWPEGLLEECGWYDQGQAMIDLALQRPQEAHQRWQHLLETDGERIVDDEFFAY